jgi:tetratricopeptide (TPR) repeat protein
MLPPRRMSAKIISFRSAVLFIALTACLSGCTPAGPRALLKGKKYLDQGNGAAALAQLKLATELLATNAAAWNYYGVALQRSGQLDEAATAYETALRCNRDLVEAHFNLGGLWLEQNKPADAKAELTAFTQFRPNEAAGWLKLGSAQLKLGEIVPAEKSFSKVRDLKSNDAEAYNGFGLASIQRGRWRDAAQWFTLAKQARPDYAPAILNLATVSQQYLRDNKTALENYRAYLALTPRPANWEEVNSLATGLEFTQVAAAPAPVVVKATSPAPAPAPAPVPAPEPKPQPKISNVVTSHPAISNPPETVVKTSPRGTPRPPVVSNPVPVQVVQVAPAPTIVTKPTPTVVTAAPPVEVEVPMPEPVPEKKTGFWHRVFGSNKTAGTPKPDYLEKGLTPLPAGGEPVVHASTRPVEPVPAPVSLARYSYSSPGKPAAGDRRAASGAFTKAQVFEQGEKWLDAEQWYQTAAELDPSWFEAQFNTGVLAHRLRNYPLALPRYELALAIKPDAADARYNFALALQAAGYAPDAADELKKLLAASPGDVRLHLALGNLCAQSLRDTAQARMHYLKVLDLDPKNPRAADIRDWLLANPK